MPETQYEALEKGAWTWRVMRVSKRKSERALKETLKVIKGGIESHEIRH